MTSADGEQIYCFKCRVKTDTLEVQEVVLKNGRPPLPAVALPAGPRSSAWVRRGGNQLVREAL